jgi:hypothetical protein
MIRLDTGWGRLRFGLVTVILVAHVGLVVRQFPPASLADGGLPVKGDVARYLASADGVYRIGGAGYDPTAMAGYSVGCWNSIGKKGYEVVGRLLPGVPLGPRFYAILTGFAVFLPLVYWGTARRLCPGVSDVALLVLCLALWHLDSQVAFFWGFGNVLYPGTCALLPLLLGVAWRVCDETRPVWPTVGLGLLAAWVFYAHTSVMVA